MILQYRRCVIEEIVKKKKSLFLLLAVIMCCACRVRGKLQKIQWILKEDVLIWILLVIALYY